MYIGMQYQSASGAHFVNEAFPTPLCLCLPLPELGIIKTTETRK